MKVKVLLCAAISLLISCAGEQKYELSQTELLEQFENQEFYVGQGFVIDEELINTAMKEDLPDPITELDKKKLLAKDWPSIFKKRIYIDGLGDFKSDLNKLVGAIAIKNGDNYEIGLTQYFEEGVQPEVKVPDEGTLVFKSYTKKKSNALSFFLNINLGDDELVQFSLKDTGTIVLGDSEVDVEKIIKTFENHDNLNNLFLIRTAVSTAMTHKIFKERKRRIRVQDFPSIPAGISAENKFYTSSLDYKQDFVVGVGLTSIKTIIETASNNQQNEED